MLFCRYSRLFCWFPRSSADIYTLSPGNYKPYIPQPFFKTGRWLSFSDRHLNNRLAIKFYCTDNSYYWSKNNLSVMSLACSAYIIGRTAYNGNIKGGVTWVYLNLSQSLKLTEISRRNRLMLYSIFTSKNTFQARLISSPIEKSTITFTVRGLYLRMSLHIKGKKKGGNCALRISFPPFLLSW